MTCMPRHTLSQLPHPCEAARGLKAALQIIPKIDVHPRNADPRGSLDQFQGVARPLYLRGGHGAIVETVKAEELAELMQTLDDAWNAGPNSPLWETFRKRHTEDVKVYWPGQPEATRGRHNHDVEAVEFFKTFPDNHLINRPYKIFFAAVNHTCSVADFTGTMKGPMKMGGKTIPPTNRSFKVEFCTIATWDERGEIIEERLCYDLVGLMKQIGLG
jgi:SnoaL-like polyketide cyclase